MPRSAEGSVAAPQGLTMSAYSRNLPGLVVAMLLYGAFAVYLYLPYFDRFSTWQWLLPASVWLAGAGCYVLSRRWVPSLLGSLLAGAVYGFGPFMLALGRFHPTAGFLAATIPWLFMPAAYLSRRRGVVSALLSLVPFAAVILFFLFFRVVAQYRLFAAPIQAELRPRDLTGFVAPLVMVGRTDALLSLYHVPIGALVIGFSMMLMAKRFGVLLIIVAGLALTFCRLYLAPEQVAWLGVSPILWLSIPLVCLAVLAGVGLQGLVEAGVSDRKWVLATALILAALAAVMRLLAAKYSRSLFGLADESARLFVEAAKMYVLGAVAIAIVFIMAVQEMRLHWLRWIVLGAAMGLDIFLSASYIVAKVL
ncbi:MAG: hypothetical protein ACYTAS_02820 [Planctomycetota bacterium]